MEKGIKEFYDLRLKANAPIELSGGETIEQGETVVHFNTVLELVAQTDSRPALARGGRSNSAEVIWNDIEETYLQFSKGTLNQRSFSIMANSFYHTSSNPIELTQEESLEADENGEIELEYEPILLFIRDKETGAKNKTWTKVGNKKILVGKAYSEWMVEYTHLYSKSYTIYEIGRELYNHFLFFESKVRLKDDETGLTTTGIIQIPKFRVMSDLSVTVGLTSSPIIGNFGGIGYPTGGRGERSIATIHLLSEDIDTEL